MKIVYSGSSLLKIQRAKGDLSRRQAVYTLRGLSFREFLGFEGLLDCPPVALEDILCEHRKLAGEIVAEAPVLNAFERYLRVGFYPFYKEGEEEYASRLNSVLQTVLDCDYPATEDVSWETIRRTKKMLMVLAASTPQTPNMSKLYQELDTDRNQGLKMLYALERAGLLSLVQGRKASLKNLSTPEKIYCNNTNVMHALVPNPDPGVLRETFFFSQIGKDHEVIYNGVGDFFVDNQYTFEVGGKNKGFAQIRNVPDSYVIMDGTTLGLGNKIPLWLFGFLY